MKTIHIIFLVIITSILLYGCQEKATVNHASNLSNEIDSLLTNAYKQRSTLPDSAIADAEKVLSLCAGKYPKKEALAYRRIGLANRYKERYDEAICACDKAFFIEKRTNNKLGQLASLNLKAKTYKKQGDDEKAFDTYLQSSLIGEQINIAPRELGDAYNNLGSILSRTGEFNKAESYFKKALKVRKNQSDTMRLGAVYQDLGGMYLRMWELDNLRSHLDSSMVNYVKSEFLFKQIGHQKSLAKVLNNIGLVYLEKTDSTNAINYFTESLSIKRNLADSLGVANTACNICDLYIKMEHHEKASAYCKMSIAYVDTLRDYEVLANAQYLLYKIEKKQKNNSKALNHYEEYSMWNDKLNSNEKAIKIQKLVKKHERDIEVAKLEDEYRQQKYFYIIGILLTLIPIGLLMLYSISKKRLHQEEQKRRIKEEELRKESEQLRKETEGRRIEEQKLYNQVIKTLEKDAEINAVNAEIDAKLQERTKVASALHDSVCSGLVSARMHFESVKNNITPEDEAVFVRGFGLLNEAYEICREISHDLSPPMLAKFGLAPAIEDLCEKLSTPQTQLQFNATPFEERLDHQQELTLYQSIQELLQNILKHSSAAEAHVQLTDYGDSLNILVEDDGKGFDTAAIADGGIGLQRISTRVKHLGGSMDVDSTLGNGTTVIIDVPKILVPENGSIS